jgi:hypothetical protein
MILVSNNKRLLLLPVQTGSGPPLLLLNDRLLFIQVRHNTPTQMNGKIDSDLRIPTGATVDCRAHCQSWQNPKRLIPIAVQQSNTVLNARGFLHQVL